MIYLIAQDWCNTSGNHAGMKYLCNKMCEMYPDIYSSIIIPDYIGVRKNKNIIIRKLNNLKTKFLHRVQERRIYRSLHKTIKENDSILIMEYMDLTYSMLGFANRIKRTFPQIKLGAMVHLVPEKLDVVLKNKNINEWLEPIDRIFTLGTSLTDYFIKKGVNANKIFTTFHYVDEYYYKPTAISNKPTPTIIAMGNQARNISLLSKIISQNSNAHFIICQGVLDLKPVLGNMSNVTLIPFVNEDTLRAYMDKSDISLNVMTDTIGSNVIVTSLSMGLAMICSDVGSIRDYCDESNTIFCNNIEDYSNAIRLLTESPDLLYKMKLSAYNKRRGFSINKFALDICKVLE